MSSFNKRIFSSIVIVVMFLVNIVAGQDVVMSNYDSIVVSESVLMSAVQKDMDSIMATHEMVSGKPTILELQHVYAGDAFDFYVVAALLLLFGILRYINPRYFQYLLRAFRSPSFGSKQVKDQMESSLRPNALMNLFFCMSTGVYLFYVFKLSFPQRFYVFSPSVMLILIILGLVALYGCKFALMSFGGGMFNVRTAVGHYLYNVFLMNKIISVVVLPFIVLLAFTQPIVALPAMIVSLFLIFILVISRYVRSWSVLGGLFEYSRFHFFIYLCASEILPMAILTKVLVHEILY